MGFLAKACLTLSVIDILFDALLSARDDLTLPLADVDPESSAKGSLTVLVESISRENVLPLC